MKHGVYTRERSTSISTPVVAASGLPYVVGTAPVQAAEAPVAAYKPVICTDWDDAVKKLGYSDDWETYTLCEAMYSHFKLYACQPVIFCNVLDIAKNKETVAAAEMKLTDGKIKLPIAAIRESVTVRASADGETYQENEDFAMYYDDESLVIEVLDTGACAAAETLYVGYDKITVSEIGDDQIVDGLGAVDTCMFTVGETPDLILAPGWSDSSVVAAVMAAKAANISGIFKAKAICDIDCSESGAVSYDQVYKAKTDANLVDSEQIIVWPMATLGGMKFHLSTLLAGLIASVDAGNEGVPYESPSNKKLQCDGLCLKDGTEVTMTLEQANILNGQGIVTALNFVSGWVAWGNYTACYPANADVKDHFIPIGRMFKWVSNTLIKTFWSKTDAPMNRRFLDNIKESANTWLAGLVGSEYLLGARVEILDAENPKADLMAGIVRIHIYITPPSPAQEIDFVLEYDPSYVMESLTE